MAQDSEDKFKVACRNCDLTHSTNEFQSASDFVEKHKEHTGHQMKWQEAEFDYDIPTHTKWQLNCDVCDKTWDFDSEEDAREFSEEHEEYTDHKITGHPEKRDSEMKTELDLDDPVGSVKTVIQKLEGHYDDGVPVQAVYASFRNESTDVAEVRHQLRQLRDQGEIYEPTNKRLRSV